MMRIVRNQRGQAATEYILIISVVVLGLLGAASFLLPKTKAGVDKLSDTLTKRFESAPTTVCDSQSGKLCD